MEGIELNQIRPSISPNKKSVSFKNVDKLAKEPEDENSKILSKPVVEEKKDETIFPKSIVDEKGFKTRTYKCKFFGYILLLMLHTCHVYIIKPLCVILEIIFLTTIVNITADDTIPYSNLIDSAQLIVGWLILFLIPLYNFFFANGLKIISVKNSFFGKISVIIFLLIEIMINVPLTFMYDNNIYSIFLFEETGINQLLNPWLIFFPTQYILSIFELVRNFLDPLYFLAIGLAKLTEITPNQYQAYLIIILKLMIVMCVLRVLGNCMLLVMKFKSFCAKIKKDSENEEKLDKDKETHHHHHHNRDQKASGEENINEKKDL